MTLTEIKELAVKHEWEVVIHSHSSSAVVFKKGSVKIYVWYKKQEIETEIYHPKSKRYTNLVRTDYTPELLEKIFKNPRTHTGVGIYKTNDITKKNSTKAIS